MIDLLHGDCLELMAGLDANSIDSVVTDPPYGLSFMGKGWDHAVPGIEFWTEMLRVAKPGAYLLAFGGSRTFHRMACAIEDAGWEMRDTIMWLYGSGFPKSHNGPWGGTALKPAHEPIIMARKPLIGTVAANVLAYGTGGLNIDGCRVPATDNVRFEREPGGVSRENWRKGTCVGPAIPTDLGRWPANVIHDGSEEVMAGFPDALGATSNGRKGVSGACFGKFGAVEQKPGRGDFGTAARFFYCAKASRKDRNEGCDYLQPVHRANGNKWTDQDYRVSRGERPPSAESGPRKNTHPTVKPTNLMRYLCRLVTPAGGVVLDPFMGSGSTGKAALLEGFRFVGMEQDAKYFAIAQERIAQAQPRLVA
ncbi:MAG: hypothetical protein B7Z66_15970 [Chromatiales bacterium 21-64-14]|nr:MAG: hypothetical protein B7Z66_15970 [Chromatiales bacterium 21-64-14]